MKKTNRNNHNSENSLHFTGFFLAVAVAVLRESAFRSPIEKRKKKKKPLCDGKFEIAF